MFQIGVGTYEIAFPVWSVSFLVVRIVTRASSEIFFSRETDSSDSNNRVCHVCVLCSIS